MYPMHWQLLYWLSCSRSLMIPLSKDWEASPVQTAVSNLREKWAGSTLYYAHHPTEIRATLTAAANYPHKKIWCVFQPHTYTRTKALLPEFAQALTLADHVILADIYAARETNTIGISSADLQERIQALGTPCEYFPSFDEIENYILSHCASGDLLITMGAGDVVRIGEQLLGK